jgi:hypothetical protein
MTSLKKERQHAILELFYNRKHKRGHSIVENNGILKKTFKVLMQKSNLDVKMCSCVVTNCITCLGFKMRQILIICYE